MDSGKVTRDVARLKKEYRQGDAFLRDPYKAIMDAAYNLATDRVKTSRYDLLLSIAAYASVLAEEVE